jgi:ATP-dependent Lhr-like helicase
VQDAAGLPPTVPFWFGEAPARTEELSEEVGRPALGGGRPAGRRGGGVGHRRRAGSQAARSRDRRPSRSPSTWRPAASPWARCQPGSHHRRALLRRRRRHAAGLHAPLGGRINKAWGLALRKRFCRSFNFELQAAATDDGIVISLGPVHSFPLEEVFAFLTAATAREVLVQAVLARRSSASAGGGTPPARWRSCAGPAATGCRHRSCECGPTTSSGLVFPQANACLENVVGDIELPDHPLVFETMRDCLVEFLDADGLVALLERIERGRDRAHRRDTLEPSPLSHEILNANPYAFLDDAPLEERRTRAVNLPRRLRAEVDATPAGSSTTS